MHTINMLFLCLQHKIWSCPCRISFLSSWVTLRGNSCVSLVLRWEYNKSFSLSPATVQLFSITWLHDYCITRWGRWFGNLSFIGKVLMHFATLVLQKSRFFWAACIFCKAYVHRHTESDPKRSLNVMQMLILVFLWLCKKIYMHLILYKNKSIENYS